MIHVDDDGVNKDDKIQGIDDGSGDNNGNDGK